jgi:iron complex transport system ATP-binding protein
MSADVLTVQGLTCRLGRRDVLTDVDLALRDHELTVVVGPNGAGKSTLLGALSGDVAPARGSVRLDGRELRDWSPQRLARRRAFLAQSNEVSFGFTVREVVTMGRHPWDTHEDLSRDHEVVATSLARTDTLGLADRSFRELSGGEKARVSLARVLAQDTHVVLLDEPTAALDLRHTEEVLALATRLARDGRAVVVVAHDLSLAATHADRLVVVAEGRVAADGPPTEVLTPDLVRSVWGLDVEVHRVAGGIVVVPVREPAPTTPPRGIR